MMKQPSKTAILFAVIAILVTMNVGLMVFMWFQQRPDNGPAGPAAARILVKELNFDQAQQEKYQQLQKQLSDSLNPIRESERHIHDRFFEMMHAEHPDSALVAATIDSMGHIRAMIEYYTFSHFRQVRALCNPEQVKKFDQIIAETMRRLGPPPPPGRKHRGGPPDGPPPGPEDASPGK